MTEGLPSIMGLESDPYLYCPSDDTGLRCNCYKIDPCPNCPLREIHSVKRVKVKGHYRVIARDRMGRIISSKKWHSAKNIHLTNDKMEEENADN